jgi:hypothetical protein
MSRGGRKNGKTVSVLCWGDISTLGAGGESGEGYQGKEETRVSISLLLVQADIQALSRRDNQSGPDGATAVVCGDLLDIDLPPILEPVLMLVKPAEIVKVGTGSFLEQVADNPANCAA